MVFSAVIGTSAANPQTTLEQWKSQWNSIKNNTNVIALTPGSDESEMNFAWLSAITDNKPEFKFGKSISMADAAKVPVTSSLAINANYANKAAVTGLEPNTVYYYSYTVKGIWSAPATFKTGNSASFKALLVSDAQIGRSGDERLDEVLLKDSYGWNSTLETAFSANPDINFILSAGDQVESAYSSTQYNLFLAPKVLRNVPIAAVIGNHDFYFPLYKYHFNNPNEFKNELVECPGGSGYWFRYGNALFIVLNSTLPVPANQELLIKQAVTANPDAVWRVVLMHNSIYGAEGGEPGTVNLWRFYAPVFDKYKIDLVLSGHDHALCRTYPLKNNTIASDGNGVVYLSESSASGSNYGSVPAESPWYAASCKQVKEPTYSVLEFKEGSLAINTFRADNMEKIDDEYIMKKQVLDEATIPAQSIFAKLADLINNFIMVMKSVL